MLEYRLRLHGLPLRWHTVIGAWTPGERFIDWQAKGPYAVWHHEHWFQDYLGGTLIGDDIHYALPFGPLGEIASPLVERDVRAIFAYRRRAIEKLMGARR